MKSQESHQQEGKVQPSASKVSYKQKLSQTNKNKSLGFHIEKVYEDIFIGLGFANCKSTKNSKLLDKCKVDFTNLPVLIQLKAGYQKELNEVAILQSMEKLLKQYSAVFATMYKMPKLILHHKPKKEGARKRSKYDSIVTMTFEDFVPLLLAYQKQIENDTQK